MPGALEAVDAYSVDAELLSLDGVTDGHGLVDHLHPCRLERRHVGSGVSTGSFDDPDTAVDDGIPVLVVRHRIDGGKDGQVDAEWFVGEIPAASDLLDQGFGSGLG